MNFTLIAPLLLTVLGIGAAVLMPRAMRPAVAAPAMTAILLAAGVAIISGTALIALAGLSPFHDVAERAGWCPGIHADDHGVPVAVALPAAALLGTSLVRGRRYLRAMRSHHAAFVDVEGITILHTDAPIAVAVPGRPGGIVVGSTLMNTLDVDEQSALLAHEQAHLTFNHHRYVHTSGLIAAMLPPLAPLARQVRFMTERWADETAAEQIGSRAIVARAIARVALMTPTAPRTPALTFIATGTGTRVEALVEPEHQHRLLVGAAAVALGATATLAGTTIEFHHLAEFIAHICHA